MSLLSVVIVGKNNKPLYLREFENNDTNSLTDDDLFGIAPTTDEESSSVSSSTKTIRPPSSLKQQFILHAALDRFEELAGPLPGYGWRKQGSTGTDAMWVGLLCPIEDMRVYGYWTSTKIKFIVVIRDGVDVVHDVSTNKNRNQQQLNEAQDTLLQSLVVDLHKLYVEHTMNPFYTLEKPVIESEQFEQGVTRLVDAYHFKQTKE